MKKTPVRHRGVPGALLLICLFAASCSYPVPTSPPIPASDPASTPPPQEDPFEADWNDRSIFRQGLVPSAQSAIDTLSGASVYRINLQISEDLLNVNGAQDVRYTNQESIALREIDFRLFPNLLGGSMQISNVRVGGSPVDVRYDLGNSLLIVPLLESLEPGKNVLIHTDFSVRVPDSLDQNYGILAYAEGVLALAHAYPMIPVYDDEGWNAEIPAPDGDITYTDVSWYLVRITAPAALTLVTSGTVLDRSEAGQEQVLILAGGPARDFYLAASPDYVEVSQLIGETTIRSYAPRGFEQGSQTAVTIAARALEVFSGRYAPYPYTELDIAATPTRALGIEYPGMIAITSWTYDPGNPSAQDYLEATVVHEVGHQWFYNLIGDDQLDDPWLDESLTQFATLQYYFDEYGTQGYDGYRASLDGRWARIDFADIPIGLPVAEYTGLEYSAIVYGRGPLFFVALRETMGTEAFDAFLRRYSESLAWGISTPEILQSLAESTCTCDLKGIFDEWVNRKPDR